ncbi:MTAP family purine nucleoside phosphorylase [Actinoplanes teichomyceticus]|uniref:Purine nucleoside phosphorylase n=1 Tax=Actinoplanes teichomyceticus TaxID=1867 RepID=A0A561VIP5_ACTTI|nr:MTAP family purine nucleoside phosphorylase [Actinoplanes teichomyceticus]TWG11479.1 5'-methylthioadenosine phosphorylase [Actinoplanes teichomyceticus]
MIDLGIIGGTGFYRFFEDVESLTVETPYGEPSAPVTVCTWAGRRIGFLPRHGMHHQYAPHQVPYPANVAALKQLGARQILGFNVVGSLSAHVAKGHFLLLDQFIDMTWARNATIFTGLSGAHADLAEPYCARLRRLAIAALADTGEVVHPKATALVINGPRFQTKAESRLFNSWGADVINMTQSSEATVARELEMCYVNLSYCTDYGVIAEDIAPASGDAPVRHIDVVSEFQANIGRVEPMIRRTVEALTDGPDCPCRTALDGCWLDTEAGATRR